MSVQDGTLQFHGNCIFDQYSSGGGHGGGANYDLFSDVWFEDVRFTRTSAEDGSGGGVYVRSRFLPL